MPKRSLRILKRVSSVPTLGVCEACQAQFSADPRQLGQGGLQHQFNAHKCQIVSTAKIEEAPKTKETTPAKEKQTAAKKPPKR